MINKIQQINSADAKRRAQGGAADLAARSEANRRHQMFSEAHHE